MLNLQRMDLTFDIDPSEFQERKRRRISSMKTVPPLPRVPPTSAPGVHEIATFLPGRLEFEHELDNEAEDLVKDLEFGICLEWGGDSIIEDENDHEVISRRKLIEERRNGTRAASEVKGSPIPMANGMVNGSINGHNGVNGDSVKVDKDAKSGDVIMENGTGTKNEAEVDPNADEVTQPPPIESKDSLKFKLTLLEMYGQRVERRREAKEFMFDRGLLEHKKVRLVITDRL